MEAKTFDNDKNGYDPELHAIGIEQCEAHQKAVNEINWKVVYTSPMQRTLMTTINMFKNHPNKESIQFIVLPVVREVMKTMNDVAMDVNLLLEKFAPG